MGIMGGRSRWRTMPWMVVLFGIAVVPLGVISIYFIIIQPIVIGTYCTLCLITALGMLIMIPFSLDELVAMGQFLLANTRRAETTPYQNERARTRHTRTRQNERTVLVREKCSASARRWSKRIEIGN